MVERRVFAGLERNKPNQQKQYISLLRPSGALEICVGLLGLIVKPAYRASLLRSSLRSGALMSYGPGRQGVL